MDPDEIADDDDLGFGGCGCILTLLLGLIVWSVWQLVR